MENRIQLSKDEIIMGFVASCVEDVADTLCVDYSEVYQRMDAVKMIEEYIIPNYEVLHSETLNVSLKEALDLFYKSETCRRFHDEETGLYLQGNLYVLNDFLAEISKPGVV